MSRNIPSQGQSLSDSAPTLIMIIVMNGVSCAEITPKSANLSHMSGCKTIIRGREKATLASIINNDTPIILKNKTIKGVLLIKIG